METTQRNSFTDKKYGIAVSRRYIKNAYPDPLCIDGMTDAEFQSAVDEAVEELESYQSVQSVGNVEHIMKDFANLLWGEFIKKYPTLYEMDMWFLGELEAAMLNNGARYVNEEKITSFV